MTNTLSAARRALCALAVATLLPAWAPSASAGVGSDRLAQFFNEVQSFQADFLQTLRNPGAGNPQQSRGTVKLERPGRFRWDYTDPYKQQIVGDGSKVWLYDEDLEQVTVKPADEALGSTPSQLLSSNEPLDKTFTVTELGEDNGVAWVELTPKTEEAGFERMALAFRGPDLVAMSLTDSLGQTTRLSFTNTVRNPQFDAKVFQFVPPEGVDVIGQ